MNQVYLYCTLHRGSCRPAPCALRLSPCVEVCHAGHGAKKAHWVKIADTKVKTSKGQVRFSLSPFPSLVLSSLPSRHVKSNPPSICLGDSWSLDLDLVLELPCIAHHPPTVSAILQYSTILNHGDRGAYGQGPRQVLPATSPHRPLAAATVAASVCCRRCSSATSARTP